MILEVPRFSRGGTLGWYFCRRSALHTPVSVSPQKATVSSVRNKLRWSVCTSALPGFPLSALTLFPKMWGFHCKSHSHPLSTSRGLPRQRPAPLAGHSSLPTAGCPPQDLLWALPWREPPKWTSPECQRAPTLPTSSSLCAHPDSPLPFLDQHFNKVLTWAFSKIFFFNFFCCC